MSMHRIFCFCSLLLFLTACGGGGGGNSSEVSKPVEGGGGENVQTGQFIDSAVSGIRYVTATRSGTTDSNGQFEYLDGEAVSFYIGEQLLGDAPGAATISLFDLVDGVTPLVGSKLEATLKQNLSIKKRGPSFATVVNLAVLLQTLDRDGDPDNGIEIPEEVAALFTADSVNFNRYWKDFEHDLGFRKVLGEAKYREILASDRQVRKPWRAMAHVYAGLGIDSELQTVSVETEGHDGNAPGSTVTYTYDDEGMLTREERLFSYNTEPQIATRTFDAHGNQTGSAFDSDGDGVSEYSTHFTYDVDGNLTRVEPDPDVTWESRSRVEIYSYDRYGNRTSVETFSRQGTLTYDADGRPMSADYDEFDDFGSFSTKARETWTYSGDGYQKSHEHIGTFINTGTFDADDNLVREETDYDYDGIADWIHTYTYDDRGNQVRDEYDNDGDEDGNRTPDSVVIRTYDARDNMIRQEVRVDGALTSSMSYNYDANGNPTRYEEDANGDGIPETSYATAYEYDSDGNKIRSEVTGEGTSGEIDEFTYDANGYLIRQTQSLADGTHSTYTWEYATDKDGWWRALQYME